jgi:hypothetical protein
LPGYGKQRFRHLGTQYRRKIIVSSVDILLVLSE